MGNNIVLEAVLYREKCQYQTAINNTICIYQCQNLWKNVTDS